MNRTTNCRRGGYVMVLLAMMFFGLLAMAALVIDLGFARLAQRQMQTAADAAALEGARMGDREAIELIGFVFDDDFDTTDDPLQFGAGPIVTLQDSPNVANPQLAASQDLSIPQQRSYKPDVQVGPGGNPGEYQVILQRGLPIDASLTPNLFAQGPPLEFLFGRGSLMPRDRILAGVSVGAVARTVNQPVMMIGDPVPQLDQPDLLPFAVSIQDWNDDDVTNPDETTTPDNDLFFSSTSRVIGPPVGEVVVPVAGSGYLAIFSSDAGNRIIGFGLGTIVISDSGQRVERSPNQIATVNVLAVPPPSGLRDLGDDSDAIFSQRGMASQSLLVAPVLVRN